VSPPTPDPIIRAKRPSRGVLQRIAELLVVLVVAPAALGGTLWLFSQQPVDAEGPSPHVATERNMEVLDRRVHNHMRRHGEAPRSLDAVTFSVPPIDGYGNLLHYVRKSSRSWDLWSRGADGVKGGTGEDADVSWTMLREARETAMADGASDPVAHVALTP
jgi:hypothetical protein